MGRRPCCAKEGLNKGTWSAGEDRILVDYIKVHGEGKWRDLPQRAGLKRCGKSCRLRWMNYLRPDIKRGNISVEEEELIIRLYKLLGSRWSLIAGRLPGRTDNEIKNYWNSNLSKRIQGRNITKKRVANNLKEMKSMAQSGEVSSYSPQVIRAKAMRCTKIVITPEMLGPYDDRIIHKKLRESDNDEGQGKHSLDLDLANSDFGGVLLDVNVGCCDPGQNVVDEGRQYCASNNAPLPCSVDLPISLHESKLDALNNVEAAGPDEDWIRSLSDLDLESLGKFLSSEEQGNGLLDNANTHYNTNTQYTAGFLH